MNTNLYSVFDTVAEVFNKPFIELTDATAIRSFTNSVEESVNKNDFVLYKLAQYNDLNGQISPVENPIKIISGIEIKSSEVDSNEK